jgi:hypothetical protein
MTILKKILPYLLTSLIVIGLWRIFTLTDNYSWSPKGKERLMLNISLTTIFFYKSLFWLAISNMTVYSVIQVLKKNYKKTFLTSIIILAWYFFAGQVIDKKCAFSYYVVFINQSVSEPLLEDPIKAAGYYIGPILTEKIKDKQMELRRYAIDGLGEIKYKPATETLNQILSDKTEPDYLRADAFVALKKFDTDISNKILTDFRRFANDTTDNKVIQLVDYWEKSN